MRLDRDVRGQSRWAVVVGLNLLAALRKKESALLPSPPTHKRNAGLEREAKNQTYCVMASPVRSISAARMRKRRPHIRRDLFRGRVLAEKLEGGVRPASHNPSPISQLSVSDFYCK